MSFYLILFRCEFWQSGGDRQNREGFYWSHIYFLVKASSEKEAAKLFLVFAACENTNGQAAQRLSILQITLQTRSTVSELRFAALTGTHFKTCSARNPLDVEKARQNSCWAKQIPNPSCDPPGLGF